MPQFDVALLTEYRFLDEENKDAYVQNVILEDRLLIEALARKGLKATRVSWQDSSFNWREIKLAVIRTTWNYTSYLPEFLQRLRDISEACQLINSCELAEWNIHKGYLHELEAGGVRVVPTHIIKKDCVELLSSLCSKFGWDDVVLKPAIGAGGKHTFRLYANETDAFEPAFRKLIAREDFMLQPFQQSVLEQGEWSFMVFGDTFSHAVIKHAKSGEFRVQDDFGGRVQLHQATENAIDFALKTKAACPGNPAYARIDVVTDNEGMPALSEVELIEPELWFRLQPNAAELFATAIKDRFLE